MDNKELKRIANQVRKNIVTGVHAAKSGHRADRCPPLMCLRICMVRK